MTPEDDLDKLVRELEATASEPTAAERPAGGAAAADDGDEEADAAVDALVDRVIGVQPGARPPDVGRTWEPASKGFGPAGRMREPASAGIGPRAPLAAAESGPIAEPGGGPGSGAWQSTAGPAGATGSVASATRFQGWLERLVDRHGSDLLLVAGAPPAVRVRGRVSPLPDEDVLDGAAIESAVLPALSRLAQQRYREQRIADASLQVSGLGRFRVNLHRERGRAAAAIRSLPSRPPRLADLNLPPSVEHLTRLPRGLVLIGGPTGAGKSTTLAAIVDEINRRDHRHIVAIEDPIEFEHLHHRSVVEQVEIGDDAPDFPTALRAALRQAPDVIVVGEMRDTETMQIAVAAAETGHLVLSTVHSPDVTSTIARVADSFPPERQNTIRQGLSVALAAVLTQMLLPRVGGGLVPAAELLMVGYGARQHVRKNALQHLHQEITLSRRHGSFTFEDSLAHVVRQGLVDRDEAAERAFHRHEFDEALRAGTPLPDA
jgi:twitching motility protein PilT